MKFLAVLGLVLVAALAVSAAEAEDEKIDNNSFFSELLREIKKQEEVLHAKGLIGAASQFMEEARRVGGEFVQIFRDAAVKANGGDVPDIPKNDDQKTIVDIIAEMLGRADLFAGNDTTTRHKRDTAEQSKDLTAILSQLMAAAGPKSSDAQASAAEAADKPADSSATSAETRLGNPAPVVLIPGPPGKPGLPGIPGLPGKNGKIPNFRGLKAIFTTRVAELIAFLAVVAVASVLKFLGLLGLLLGLVLPIYGKLKKAGALVPTGAEPGYGQDAGYGAPPAPAPYGPAGRRKRAVPMNANLYNTDRLAAHVMSSIEAAINRL